MIGEELLDAFARELYHQRSQSPREMTDERWANVKARFPGTVRVLREDVLRMVELGDL